MIALVACSATKLGHRAPARELYQGDTFKLVRRILEHPASRVDDWAILSAKHGLVLPTDALDPYDLYLGDLPTDERAAWHERVLDQIARAWGTSQVYEIYAGAYYTNLQWYRTLPHMERVYATWAREHSNSPSRTRFGIGHIRRRLAIRLATLDAAAEVSPPLLADEVPTAPVLNPRTHRLGSQMAWLFEPTTRTPEGRPAMKQTDLFAPAPATPGAAAPSPPASPTLSLHRMHAAPASGTGGSSFDLGAVRWRGEGGDTAWKRSAAHRLCLCWNLCEGWPTSTLEDGVLRELDDVSFRLEAALTDLLANDPCALPREIITLVETASALRAARDADYDDTDGRPHDCPDCLRKGL